MKDEKINDEIWKPVVGSEDRYEVSNKGNVRSIDKYLNHRYGPFLKKGKPIKPQKNHAGYICLGLIIDGKPRTRAAHRIVAQAFIPNPENKPQVNHINGIKDDNRVENLEWATQEENIRHSFDIGLRTNEKMISCIKWMKELNTTALKSEIVRLNEVIQSQTSEIEALKAEIEELKCQITKDDVNFWVQRAAEYAIELKELKDTIEVNPVELLNWMLSDKSDDNFELWSSGVIGSEQVIFSFLESKK